MCQTKQAHTHTHTHTDTQTQTHTPTVYTLYIPGSQEGLFLGATHRVDIGTITSLRPDALHWPAQEAVPAVPESQACQ